eukprot:NODE_2562_length_914_cov_303.767171.p5 GENE.NODE_2562_length_914_cov_303.767171~~NODE_2562_length_914_cov_303.767171.p5  ORF type:complete len:126 (+),score=24.69 NODE_2562_length_914_cov_303.767171:3-380(+)
MGEYMRMVTAKILDRDLEVSAQDKPTGKSNQITLTGWRLPQAGTDRIAAKIIGAEPGGEAADRKAYAGGAREPALAPGLAAEPTCALCDDCCVPVYASAVEAASHVQGAHVYCAACWRAWRKRGR